MCGRAGRDGSTYRAHIFFSQRKKLGLVMKDFCEDTENCRRKKMLSFIGSTEALSRERSTCCDVCNPLEASSFVMVVTEPHATIRKPRRQRVRRVASDSQLCQLRNSLEGFRQSYLASHPSFLMLGADFVLPSAVISAIIQDIDFVSSAEYIGSHYSVRPELCDGLFSEICKVLSA